MTKKTTEKIREKLSEKSLFISFVPSSSVVCLMGQFCHVTDLLRDNVDIRFEAGNL
jgi:hypothetical protein